MREVIKKKRVRLVESAEGRGVPRAATAGPPAGCASVPGVRLLELDTGGQAIEFTCACGEISVLEIELAAAPHPRSSP